jgi:hypothetical protein
MKINKLIEELQSIAATSGNIEVFIADSYISPNNHHNEIKDFNLYDTWYTAGKKDKPGILLGIEEIDA